MKGKIVTLLGLSAIAIPALASCGGGGPRIVPGVHFFANSVSVTLNGGDLEYKKEAYVNGECATFEIEDAENLRYGEKDVVIYVKPQLFFTFKQWDLEELPQNQTWAQRGAATRPYVGLGSPTNPYSFELTENVAWTFEDVSEKYKDSDNIERQHEKYKITVKKEFFQKDIVIAYGTARNNPIYVHASEYYTISSKCKHFLSREGAAQKEEPKEYGDGDGLWDGFLTIDDEDSDAAAPNAGLYLSCVLNSSDDPKHRNGLLSFNKWDEDIEEVTDDAGEVIGHWYNKFNIYGVKTTENGTTTRTPLSYTDETKPLKQQFRVLDAFGHKNNVLSEEECEIIFYIPWVDIVGEDYSVMYDEIEICMDPPFLTKVNFNADALKNDGYIVESGYFNKYYDNEDPKFDTYTKGRFRVTPTGNTSYIVSGGNYYGTNCSFANGERYSYNDCGDCAFGATILHEEEDKNIKVTLKWDGDDKKVELNTTKQASQTTWRTKHLGGTSPQNFELSYWSDNGWTLVKLVPGKCLDGQFDTLEETYKSIYYLLPIDNVTTTIGERLNGFTAPNDVSKLASTLDITVDKA